LKLLKLPFFLSNIDQTIQECPLTTEQSDKLLQRSLFASTVARRSILLEKSETSPMCWPCMPAWRGMQFESTTSVKRPKADFQQ
jgi:hypothetical protein